MLSVSLRGRFFGSGPFSGTVYSVHDQVINLLPTDANTLLSIVARPRDMAPGAICAPMFPTTTGTAWSFSFPKVVVGDVRIDVSHAEPFDGRPARAETPSSSYLKDLETLFREAASFGMAADTDPLSTRIWARLREHGPASIVGAGQGLTPSGDDFLTGALLAQFAHGAGRPLPTDDIRGRLNGTTLPGRTLLTHALDREFPAYLLDFLRLAVRGDAARDVVGLLSSHGASSGLDAGMGYLWQLTVQSSAHTSSKQF